MKSIYRWKLIPLVCLMTLSAATVQSCKKSEETKAVKVYEYREQIGKKIKELSDLLGGATFGFVKGMYPESSRSILETAISDLKNLLVDINTETIAVNNVPQATSEMLNKAASSADKFLASKRAEDLIVPAELYVDGKAGGYIDFGNQPEFFKFEDGFTVDVMVKIKKFGYFDFILSSFIDNEIWEDNYRYGWAVNYYGVNDLTMMRMSYVLGKNGLFEPGINGFNTTNEWVQLAFVWNPNKSADGGNPHTFKMYINGELVKEENWHDTNYTPNLTGAHLIGLNHTNFDGSLANQGRGTQGYMKHMHIWKGAKSQADLKSFIANPDAVTGKEADLVCGWKLTQVSFDDNNILDITGKYSAKVVGSYKWEEIQTP